MPKSPSKAQPSTWGFKPNERLRQEIDMYLKEHPRQFRTKSAFLETCVKKYLHPDEQDLLYTYIYQRMGRQKKALERNAIKIEMLGDLMLAFTRYFFQRLPFPEYDPETTTQADMDANATWGKFRSFLKAQWEAGPQFELDALDSSPFAVGKTGKGPAHRPKPETSAKPNEDMRFAPAVQGTRAEGVEGEPVTQTNRAPESSDPAEKPLSSHFR